MKIYFSGSISGGRQNLEDYIKIGKVLKSRGHIILTEHILDPNLDCKGEQRNPTQIFERDIEMMEESDLVIAEISTPSHGVGYELAWAVEHHKPILCLLDGKLKNHKISAMIEGNTAKNFRVKKYTSETLEKIILEFIEQFQ